MDSGLWSRYPPSGSATAASREASGQRHSMTLPFALALYGRSALVSLVRPSQTMVCSGHGASSLPPLTLISARRLTPSRLSIPIERHPPVRQQGGHVGVGSLRRH